jgi:SOS-response transcriptional repressor LexA
MASIAGMKHLGKVVRDLRKMRGLTLEAVANQVPDYDSGNLSRFERGLQDIAIAKLEAIAAVLNTPMHEMMRSAGALDDAVVANDRPPAYGGRESLQVVASLSTSQNGAVQGVQRMPVLTDAQAASLAVGSDALSTATEFIETTSDFGRGSFGWRVPDDSMMGQSSISFAPGMTVLFQPLGSHTAGDCVLVRLSATEVQFCQLTRAGGLWYMTSLNRRYQPRELPAGATVLGVAVAAQFKVPRGGT